MRLIRYDGDRLGLLPDSGDGIVDLSSRLDLSSVNPLVDFLERGVRVDSFVDEPPDAHLDDVTLESPLRRPGKIVAAPANYERHIHEALDDPDISLDEWFTIEDFGYFLKAPSSIIGPSASIVLPFSDRRVDHEVELAFVMGKRTKDATGPEVWDNIFGYTVLLDITVRGDQDRSNRKSYDSFTVVGPWIVTSDAISDPQGLDLALWVNGEIRQQSNTRDMVYSCGDIVQYASIGTTLDPGDLLTTGTPEGVGPIRGGDCVEAKIESIGRLVIPVEEREEKFDDLRL